MAPAVSLTAFYASVAGADITNMEIHCTSQQLAPLFIDATWVAWLAEALRL